MTNNSSYSNFIKQLIKENNILQSQLNNSILPTPKRNTNEVNILKTIQNSIVVTRKAVTNITKLFNQTFEGDDITILNNFNNTVQTNIQNNTQTTISDVSIPTEISFNTVKLSDASLTNINVDDNTLFKKNLIVVNNNSDIDSEIVRDDFGFITTKDLFLGANIIFNNELIYKDINDNEFLKLDSSNNKINVKTDLATNKKIIFNNNNQLYVLDNNLYYNNNILNTGTLIGLDILTFFFDIESKGSNFNSEFETALRNELRNEGIDDTNILINLTDIDAIKVVLTIKVGLSDLIKTETKINLQKINELVKQNRLIVLFNEINIKMISNIYLYNNCYYFDDVSVVNSFKLVKRSDESASSAIKSGHQVYLKNLKNEFLLNDFTFGTDTTKKLLLEVYGYKDFFISAENGLISVNNGFKLEVLPSLVIDENIPSVIIGETVDTNVNCTDTGFSTETTQLSNDFFITNADSKFTNIGINPLSTDFEKYFLALDPNEFINSITLDPDTHNDVYLVDNRWLTFQECGNSGEAQFLFSYTENNSNSQKFYNGIYHNQNLNIGDYVFQKSYKLESIEEHSRFMFKNKHLPSLISANEIHNLYNPEQRREHILEELEKAHIYIHKLNERIKILEKNSIHCNCNY